MKPSATSLGVVVFFALVSTTFAQVVGCGDRSAIEAACGGAVAQVVCINDFIYNPPVVHVSAGDTVAWVNVEDSCPMLKPPTGCDSHHQVVTLPDLPSATGDSLTLAGICSPTAGTAGLVVPTAPAACRPGESNVRCHRFHNPGVQHYTCETNQGHTALMHGVIVVTP